MQWNFNLWNQLSQTYLFGVNLLVNLYDAALDLLCKCGNTISFILYQIQCKNIRKIEKIHVNTMLASRIRIEFNEDNENNWNVFCNMSKRWSHHRWRSRHVTVVDCQQVLPEPRSLPPSKRTTERCVWSEDGPAADYCAWCHFGDNTQTSPGAVSSIHRWTIRRRQPTVVQQRIRTTTPCPGK